MGHGADPDPGELLEPQLRILRHLGLAAGERDGRRVVYSLHVRHDDPGDPHTPTSTGRKPAI